VHYPSGERWLPIGETALGCVLLFGIRRRNGRYARFIAGLLLLSALTQSVSGCGSGGGGNNGGGGGGTAGTTPGNYTITVTGTSGTLVKTGMLTLTVK
jgi:hypothetical protein